MDNEEIGNEEIDNEEISDEKFLRLSMLEKNLGPEMGKHGKALLRRMGKKAMAEGKKRRKEEYRILDEKIANRSKEKNADSKKNINQEKQDMQSSGK